ncbi:DUF6750 family protein [Acidithiobacillus sp. IBUN Pt1247-S3]|uniref:DUF6750 family protein n=1 Tax=Acidithiobacillus sp. IBUN Pt1247-S3 TaxID=3166642 RepID=UPI0034E5B3E1
MEYRKKSFCGKVALSGWGAGIVAMLAPALAQATVSFSQIANNGQSTVQSFSSLAVYFFIFIGIVMVGGGIVMWILAHKRQQPTWPGIAMIIGGVLLVSLTAFISSGSDTVFGSDQSQMSTVVSGG